MSNPFSRLMGRWSSVPKPIEAAAVTPNPEQEAEDQKVFQQSVSDAVNAALGNEEFTKAVAKYLAAQLQPTIESASDTSAFESKFLASSDKLTQQVNASEAQTTTKISELSGLIDTGNTTITSRISGIEESVKNLNASLAGLDNEVKAIQDKVALLDRISNNVQTIQDQGPSPIVSALSSQAGQIESLSTQLAAIEANKETGVAIEAIASKLETIKSDLEGGFKSHSSEISSVSTQINSAIAAVEKQEAILVEIKSADNSAPLLDGIKTSNDFHASHAAALSAIKIPSNNNLEAKVDTIAIAVSELKSTDLSSDILAGVKASNEALGEIKASDISPDILAAVKETNSTLSGHSTSFSEIKTIVSTPATAEKVDLSTIESSLQKITTDIEAQSTALTEVKSIVSVSAPAVEKTDLSGLETSIEKVLTNLDTQTTTLSEVKSIVSVVAPAAEKIDISTIETSLQKVTADIEAQSTTLTEVKSLVSVPAPAVEKTDLSGLETSMEKVLTTLDTQTSALSDIKAISTNSEVVSTLATQTTILTEIKSDVSTAKSKLDTLSTEDVIGEVKGIKVLIEAIPAPIPAKDNDSFNADLLQEVKHVKTVVDETKVLVAAIPAPIPAKDNDSFNADLLQEVKQVKTVVDETKKETEAIVVLVTANSQSMAKEVESVKPTKMNGENGVKVEEVAVEAEVEEATPAAA